MRALYLIPKSPPPKLSEKARQPLFAIFILTFLSVKVE